MVERDYPHLADIVDDFQSIGNAARGTFTLHTHTHSLSLSLSLLSTYLGWLNHWHSREIESIPNTDTDLNKLKGELAQVQRELDDAPPGDRLKQLLGPFFGKAEEELKDALAQMVGLKEDWGTLAQYYGEPKGPDSQAFFETLNHFITNFDVRLSRVSLLCLDRLDPQLIVCAAAPLDDTESAKGQQAKEGSAREGRRGAEAKGGARTSSLTRPPTQSELQRTSQLTSIFRAPLLERRRHRLRLRELPSPRPTRRAVATSMRSSAT